MANVASSPDVHDRPRLLVPGWLWTAVIVVIGLTIGLATGFLAGGVNRTACNASSCHTFPFPWHDAVRNGGQAAVITFGAGYLVLVIARLFLRFAESPHRS
jgi:hypothetical protein